MKTYREIRHENFLKLFEDYKARVRRQFPEQPDRGMLRHMSKAFDKSERFLSHMNCDAKPMGKNVARELEALMGYPEGWMDNPETSEPIKTEEDVFANYAKTAYRLNPVEAQSALLGVIHRHLKLHPAADSADD